MKSNPRSFRFPLIILSSLLAVAALVGCGGKDTKDAVAPAKKADTGIPVDANLKQRLDEFAHKPRVAGRFGLCVYDLTADKPVYAFQENDPIPSASCMKLLSGVAGYHLLGTHYNYETSLFIKGRMADGLLRGSVILKGSADPNFTPDDLKFMARMLRKNGVKELDGNIILDLLLNEPVQAEAHWYPWDLERSKYGLLYQGSTRIGNALVAACKAQGIKVKADQVVTGKTPRGAHRVARSIRTIDRVVERMWKNSSNPRATAMLYTIGQHLNANDSAQKVGVAYLNKFLKQTIHENNPKIVVHDGCGLCRYNRLSAQSLVDILRYGYADKAIFNRLWKHLSVAGVDGTACRLLSGPELRGKLRVKTGTLSHPYGISTLAGYCEAPNGHLLAFAIMDSEMSVLDAHVLQRNLCKVLVKEVKGAK